MERKEQRLVWASDRGRKGREKGVEGKRKPRVLEEIYLKKSRTGALRFYSLCFFSLFFSPPFTCQWISRGRVLFDLPFFFLFLFFFVCVREMDRRGESSEEWGEWERFRFPSEIWKLWVPRERERSVWGLGRWRLYFDSGKGRGLRIWASVGLGQRLTWVRFTRFRPLREERDARCCWSESTDSKGLVACPGPSPYGLIFYGPNRVRPIY